jgi:phage tail-like protein
VTDNWWPEGYKDPAFVVQRQIYGSEAGGDYVRGSTGYATQSAGFVAGLATAPDAPEFRITSDVTIVAKIKLNDYNVSVPNVIANQRLVSTDINFLLQINTAGHLSFRTSTNGTAFTTTNVTGGSLNGLIANGSIATVAVSLDIDNGAAGHTYQSKYWNGTAWTNFGTPIVTAGVITNGFDSTQPMRIGQQTGTPSPFTGVIYSVEMRSGLNPAGGTVLWRFDPNDWTVGTTFVNEPPVTTPPTGRTWTLSLGHSITPAAPVFVRTLPYTALRYPTTVKGFDAASNIATLIGTWNGHKTMKMQNDDGSTTEVPIGAVTLDWGWPTNVTGTWTEVALVRSGFGRPSTVTDGETIFWSTKTVYTDPDTGEMSKPPPTVVDQPLQRGHWYYYSLFFKTGVYNWITGMTCSVLVPQDYHHADHLWDAVPPFYQNTDSNISEGTGPLRKFLGIFGNELDVTREYIDQWQETMHVDKSPVPLLRHVGENFGEPYRAGSGLGDVRYRALIAALPELLQQRGTPIGLTKMIESTFKVDIDITDGKNLMSMPDDSIYSGDTGNWGTTHTGAGVGWNALDPTLVFLTNGGQQPPAPYGKKSMRIQTAKANETASFSLACGCMMRPNGDSVHPRSGGIAIQEGYQYAMDFWIYAETAVNITQGLLWFDKYGRSVDYLGMTQKPPSLVDPVVPATVGTWTHFFNQGIAPPSAVLLTPAIYFRGRTTSGIPARSSFMDIAGFMVYLVDQASVAKKYVSPDKFLTLGDPQELLGVEIAGQEATTGFIIGDPREL